MSSGFITESEAAEARRLRQEEWEKVRTAEQPLERPEEPYDSRSLYERLKEQKTKKDMEYEEAHKLKNLIRGLDDDEVEFLDLVDRTKMNAEKQQMLEEKKELDDFRQRVVSLQEKTLDEKLQSEKAIVKSKVPISSNRTSQKSILSGVVVRKRKNGDEEFSPPSKKQAKEADTEKATPLEELAATNPTEISNIKIAEQLDKGAMRCVAILPGIGRYKDSSDSELSSDTDEEFEQPGRYDLVGRSNIKDTKKKGTESCD